MSSISNGTYSSHKNGVKSEVMGSTPITCVYKLQIIIIIIRKRKIALRDGDSFPVIGDLQKDP